MNKLLATIALYTCLSTPCFGEIIFDWSKTNIHQETRRKAEQTVTSAALKFMDKQYADLGEYDFVQSKEKYTVAFVHNRLMGYWIPAWQMIGLDPRLTKNEIILKAVALHEFSHAYETIKIKNISDKTLFYRRLSDSERLANIKERVLFEEIKKENPAAHEQVLSWYRKADALEMSIIQRGEKMQRTEIDALVDKELQKLFDEMPSH